jgi:hypothetical protein
VVAGGQTAAAIAVQPEWLALVPRDRRLPPGRIAYTGCGTSFHAAQTAGPAVQALDAALEPPDADVLVCVSHEGTTRQTIAAAEAFEGERWLVTGTPSSPLAELCEEVVVATPAIEASWCHTASYTCGVAALAALRGEEIGWLPDAVAAELRHEDADRNESQFRHSAWHRHGSVTPRARPQPVDLVHPAWSGRSRRGRRRRRAQAARTADRNESHFRHSAGHRDGSVTPERLYLPVSGTRR